jgi:addiction module HigA family antidote
MNRKMTGKRGAVQRAPTHPGEILREDVLPNLGVSKAEFARNIGVSRQMLYDILNCQRAITPSMALRLGKVLGNGPTIWVGMQQAYDLHHAEQDMATELDQLEVMYG